MAPPAKTIPTGVSLLHPTAQKLTPSSKKKVAAIWKYIETMRLVKQYDKTDFCAHLQRVKDLGKLNDKVSTIYKRFNEIETKIDTVQDMANHLKIDIKRAEKAGKTQAAEVAKADFDKNEALLNEHTSDKNKTLSAVIKLLDEYEFTKS